MGDGVHAPCQAGDDGHPGSREPTRQFGGGLASVGRCAAGADDGDTPVVICTDGAPDVEDRRCVIDLAEARGVGGVHLREGLYAGGLKSLDLGVRVALGATADDGLRGAGVESGGGEFALGGTPGIAEVGEGPLKEAEADAAEPMDAVERDAVREIWRRAAAGADGRWGGHKRQPRDFVNGCGGGTDVTRCSGLTGFRDCAILHEAKMTKTVKIVMN